MNFTRAPINFKSSPSLFQPMASEESHQSQVRTKRFYVEVSEDAKAKAIASCKKYKTPMRARIGMLIDMDDKHNLAREGWDIRLKLALDIGDVQVQKNIHADLKIKCPARFYADDAWKCLWAREGKPPQIKKLAKDLHDALSACKSCDKTGKILRHNAELKNQIIVLESRLDEKSNKTFKAPVCNYGGTLSRDGLTFSGCRLSPGKLVSVMEYCKKRMGGRPCPSYSEAIIGVGKSTK